MSAEPARLEVALPAVVLEQLAQRVAEIIEGRTTAAPAGPWLDVDEAAEYLRCSRQRIYDLSSARTDPDSGERVAPRLRVAKDGTRSLFRRKWLDAYLLGRDDGDDDGDGRDRGRSR